MKKYLLCFAIAAVAFASCNKDNGTNGGNKVKDLEATFKMETGLASLVYAEPVDIVGAAASESTPPAPWNGIGRRPVQDRKSTRLNSSH